MNKIQLGDSPYYVNPQFIITSLKNELIKRIHRNVSFEKLYIGQSSAYGEALYEYVEDHYGKEITPNLITAENNIIELYKSIKTLDKVL